MKLSAIKRFIIEDFKAQQPWIEKLLGPLNTFMSEVNTILTNGIVMQDNAQCQVFTTVLKAGVSSFSFLWKQKQAPIAILLANAIEAGSSAAPAIGLTWTLDSKSVRVSLSGLDPSKQYTITVLGLA